MAGTFKQGADRYAASLAELAKTMPDLTRKINSGAKDFSTFNDILRKGGVDALVAYKAAIGDLNSEMKKLDKSTDILSKLKKEAADLQMNVGDVVSNNLGVAGVGAAGYFLGNKLGGAGGALLSRGLPGVAGLALGKELSNSSDYGSAVDARSSESVSSLPPKVARANRILKAAGFSDYMIINGASREDFFSQLEHVYRDVYFS
jgi:hypothetical protein